jgi:NAD-dependent dihydropyrimidine dehydrogenase PreA subunit
MWLDERFGKDGGLWYMNPENFGRQLYRRRDPNRKKILPTSKAVEEKYDVNKLLMELDNVETEEEEKPIREKLNKAQENIACQVLPLKQALEVAEIVAPMASLSCVCRRMARAKEERNPDEYTCLGTGVGMLKWERWPERYKGGVEFMSPEDVKDWLIRMDKKGFMHCIMVYGQSEFGAPFIGGICNCDYADCLVMRRRLDLNIQTALLKSHWVAKVDYEECNGCGICVQRCQYGAIKFEVTMNKTNIDLQRCFGCGLCETGCPRGAIELLDREKIPGLREEW